MTYITNSHISQDIREMMLQKNTNFSGFAMAGRPIWYAVLKSHFQYNTALTARSAGINKGE